MTTEEDGNSRTARRPSSSRRRSSSRGADVIGVNCSVGPAPMLETIERIAAVTTLPLSAQPNAGRPATSRAAIIYLCSPEYMASYARRFIAARRAPRRRLLRDDARAHPADQAGGPALAPGAGAARAAAATAATRRVAGAPHARPPVPRDEKSRLAHALARGRFVIAVEVVPPRGLDARAPSSRRGRCKIRGVDASTFRTAPAPARG